MPDRPEHSVVREFSESRGQDRQRLSRWRGTLAIYHTQYATLARALTVGIVPDLVAPKILSWSLSVQHQLLRDTSIEVRYLGTHAVSLPVQIRLNEVSAFDPRFPGGGLKPLPTYLSASQIPATLPIASQRLIQNFLAQGLCNPMRQMVFSES